MELWPPNYSSTLPLQLLLSLLLCVTGTDGNHRGATTLPVSLVLEHAQRPTPPTFLDCMRSWSVFVASRVGQHYFRIVHGRLRTWDMVELLAICTILQGLRRWNKSRQSNNQERIKCSSSQAEECRGSINSDIGGSGNVRVVASTDADISDPGLLRKHSSFKSYTTSTCTFPHIRTFHRPHPQADKLPSTPTPLPLLVFIHGLGGSLAQFHPLLTSLVNLAPCLGVDLPGCGRSSFSPQSWESYTTEALVELLNVVIDQYYDRDNHQGVVLIGHSMGSSFCASIASMTASPERKQKLDVLGLIAICPTVSLPSEKQLATYKTLLNVPTFIFDIWRRWDRRGGPNSPSVARFVGADGDKETKKLQERFNEQSKTAVWRRMAYGALPKKNQDGTLTGGLPGPKMWSSLTLPIFLIAGEADGITKPSEVGIIAKLLQRNDECKATSTIVQANGLPKATAATTDLEPIEDYDSHEALSVEQGLCPSDTEATLIGSNKRKHSNGSPPSRRNHQALKTSILPAPASHSLLYDHATYRTVAGLIQSFLFEHVDNRLSLGWQLQYLSTEGKWDVKNLAKWQAVPPVSEPIAGVFRALKTLREIDDTHSPPKFVARWRGKITAVIDISHESPVYDPEGLNKGGIEYHKLPTVSKIPPTIDEVKDFIILVDRLRDAALSTANGEDEGNPLVGVHCHYGFNRTGFFICSYLIEKEGFGVQQAIDEFQAQRPPGIRHDHFIDTLFVRYCLGLKRAPAA